MKEIVRIFLKNDQNQFILVKHVGKEYYSLPGGHLEQGESIYKAIKREVKEELGVKCKLLGTTIGLDVEGIKEKVLPLCTYKLTYNEMKDKKVKKLEYIFFGEIKSAEIQKQNEEIESYSFFSLEEIINKVHTHKQVKEIARKLQEYV